MYVRIPSNVHLVDERWRCEDEGKKNRILIVMSDE